MSSIDERVVKMTMDAKQFQDGTKSTLDSLAALEKGLKLDGATKGLDDVNAAANRLSLAGIADSVSNISDKFKALSIAGITALANIANRAVDAGIQLGKSLTVDPIKAGLAEYETNLNSIQTILSNTAWQHTGLADVNAALQELNTYSDKTIYNFTEMARNIGTFTAAGVKLDVSVNAIKGIANLAAISGSSAEQASAAMYQLSQALATGTLKLQDWNSVVNAGLGGKVFQDALIETARVHGVAIDQIIKDEGSFRDSLQKGWLTSQILTETLSKFTGDLTAAQLKTMGYNDQQIAGILKMGKDAQDAATKVKTFSQLISTLQEAAGSGWTNTWQIIFGDFDEARDLFTNVNNVLGGFITASANARNKVLGDWKELGGRTEVIKAIGNVFNALLDVLGPLRTAFHEIFPATTGKQLYDLTVTIEKFTEGLRLSADTMDELRRTFAGVFAIVGIVWDVFKDLVVVLFQVLGAATEGSGGILEFTARIGDFLVGLHKAVEEGNGVMAFFQAFGRVVAVPIKIIKTLISLVGQIFSHFDGEKAAKDTADWASNLNLITGLLNAIADGGDHLNAFIAQLGEKLTPYIEKVINFLSHVGEWIIDAISGVDWSDVLATINTGLFAGIVVLLKKFVDKFKETDESGGLLDGIKDSFDQLTNTLSTMQNTLRAATLLEIAAAIGLLTISVVALSKIDTEGLGRALSAITVMFTQLFASMAIFSRIAGSKGFAQMPLVTGAMILLALAVDLLVVAVKELADLDWEELSKGLGGLTIILGELIFVMNSMPEEGKMISTGLALLALAGAVKILASAVIDLSGLSWEGMAKGLTGVAGILAALALFTKISNLNKKGVLAGAGIVLLAAGIKIIASAFQDLSQLSWEGIAKSIVAMDLALGSIASALDAIPASAVLAAASVLIVALSLGKVADALDQMSKLSWEGIGKAMTALLGALAIIAAALYVIPPTAPLAAAGILITALALGPIAQALQEFAKMSWGDIGKAMTVLTGALLIIAVGVTAMIAALPGAVALTIVVAALLLFIPVLIALGNMSWEAIGKGLATLAAVFLILGVAGAALTAVVPTLLLLGAAIALIGVGVLAAGAGILAFSIALTALSVSGAAGAAALKAIVESMLSLIPEVMAAIAQGVVAFAEVIAMSGPAITGAIVTVLNSLIDAIVVLTPKIQETLADLAVKMVKTLADHVPDMVDSGLKLLTGILNGIANNIKGVVKSATDVIVNFIHGIADNLPRVQQAGVDLIIAYIHGLADTIDNNSDEMGKAGADLALAIIKGMVKGLGSGANEVVKEAKNVAKQALNAAKSFLGINSPSKKFEQEVGEESGAGIAQGLHNKIGDVEDASTTLGKTSIEAMKKTLSGLADLVTGDFDANPTITPVLDLTNVKKGADDLNGLLNTKPITVNASTTAATNAQNGYEANQAVISANEQFRPGNDVTFNQTINSPKPVNTGEVYRNTNNLISTAKGALTKKDG